MPHGRHVIAMVTSILPEAWLDCVDPIGCCIVCLQGPCADSMMS